MARFAAPHGVRGLLRLQVFSRQPEFFVSAPQWWCRPAAGGAWRALQVTHCVAHGGEWLATLPAIASREEATTWCNGLAALPYAQLPPLEEEAFYWCDLIGMAVHTLGGEVLGEVAEIMDIGVHDVLCVEGAGGRHLIPFVAKHVPAVDSAARVIRVDWQRDW